MSYQPFLDGPGRVNDYVKVDNGIFRIAHVEDFFSPRIGWNAANNTWNITTFNAVIPRFDTGYRNLDITNIAQQRLLQLTGIELLNGGMVISLRQPAKMTRWGAGNVAEGTLNALRSIVGAPIRLRWLYSVNEKPIQMRCVSDTASKRIVPSVYLRGFLYELEATKAQVRTFFEPPIGGIE